MGKYTFIILLFLNSFCFSQKIYNIEVLADWSYTGSKTDVAELIKNSNVFFKDLGIQFVLTSYHITHINAKDKTLSNTIDNFRNFNVKESDITLGLVGEHTDSKIGLAFRGGFKSFYSCIVIAMDYSEKQYLPFVLSHEILHLMGLPHAKDEDNIMCSVTTNDALTISQYKLIEKYTK